MKPSRRTLADERGESLSLALIVLALGSLLLSPLLAHLATSYRATARFEQTVRAQYSGDAGVEYALWSLTHDDALRSDLLASPGTARDLAVPDNINGSTPGVRVVAVETSEMEEAGPAAMLPYAIFANSTSRTNTAVISGSGHRVNGDMHSNNQILITGSGNSVNGQVTYAGDISVVGSGNYFLPPPPGNPSPSAARAFPITWELADLAPGGALALQAAAEGLYTEHTDRWQIEGSGVTIPPGLHYCTGDVHISGSDVMGPNVTIVALGDIDVSGSGISLSPYISGLTFYSAKQATTNVISISGSGNTGGTAYAPGGKISLTGSGGTIIGAFLGDRVDIAGSGATIQLAPVPLAAEGSAACGVYDIESIVETTRTLVRATDCGAEGLSVISWHVSR